MLLALLEVGLLPEAGTGRYVAAGRGLAAARRKEQTDSDGRGAKSHDDDDAVLRSGVCSRRIRNR